RRDDARPPRLPRRRHGVGGGDRGRALGRRADPGSGRLGHDGAGRRGGTGGVVRSPGTPDRGAGRGGVRRRGPPTHAKQGGRMSMSEKVVAITGGAGGIGLATARRLVADGAKVAVLDLGEEAVRAAAAELSPDGSAALGLTVDTTDEAALTEAITTARQRFGRLDGLVTAAGVRQAAALALDLDMAVWERTMRVNVTGTFLAVRAAARVMIDDGTPGSIVTIASVTAASARWAQSAYCA